MNFRLAKITDLVPHQDLFLSDLLLLEEQANYMCDHNHMHINFIVLAQHLGAPEVLDHFLNTVFDILRQHK